MENAIDENVEFELTDDLLDDIAKDIDKKLTLTEDAKDDTEIFASEMDTVFEKVTNGFSSDNGIQKIIGNVNRVIYQIVDKDKDKDCLDVTMYVFYCNGV